MPVRFIKENQAVLPGVTDVPDGGCTGSTSDRLIKILSRQAICQANVVSPLRATPP
ncbi:hypothetical protein DPMN_011255 [Dreissena polymorpha]|uniref:Uncharacterized protein n=1 Tax=Dreissena polymorpha TaxID=45954 RepID=A0A9D4N4P7_DREPO|nr:hypothetical protein DPMN_011255 [Dreissena polymorpha]